MEAEKRIVAAITETVMLLVRRPEEVEVRSRVQDGVLSLDVSVATDDWGRVIGKGGKTAGALRLVASALGRNAQTTCLLNIDDARDM